MKITIKDQWGGYAMWFLLVLWTLVVFIACAALVGIGFVVDTYQCDQYGDMTGRTTTFVIPTGCYVKGSNGQFIPLAEFNKRAITNEASQP